MKIGVGKLGFRLAAGAVIALAVSIVVVAWIKGGAQPAQMVEIPANPASQHAASLHAGSQSGGGA